ncbi:hypothetical protein CYMTET_52976 [Cymbomonas tetramitiformis]|uniref:Uncharacterized protein n=1 Tax=Cymbomonas tetramitiformis TaxID=36881 RepID=A0AAE0BHY3_9CHLO|nr:hypothetical protein CYMTET_52976 [Cymbomonas tetramitiformis]
MVSGSRLGSTVPPATTQISTQSARRAISSTAAVSCRLHGSLAHNFCTFRVAKQTGLIARASAASQSDGTPNASAADAQDNTWFNDTTALPENFCIIESRDTVQDFAVLQLDEITKNIQSRRNKTFLLMEEVRRLRIQQKAKMTELGLESLPDEAEEAVYKEEYDSALPLLPPLSDETIKEYYVAYAVSTSMIILFGGIIAPILEVKLGLGGQSYAEFIAFLHLPKQLAMVDPFVASFTGGAVGVISSLMLVEYNNVKRQSKKRCWYCKGTGYLACASCSATGTGKMPIDLSKGRAGSTACCCVPCTGTGKVMCTSCLCTGMALATEHDPRIDPFQ